MTYSKSLFLFLFVFVSLLPSISIAQADNKTWRAKAIKYDWVQLTSLEWLKGEVKSMYNKKLEFDSDKLDLLSIKWDDIRYLQTHDNSNVKIENQGSIIGIITISENKITIKNDQGLNEFNRNEIISFTQTGDREIDLWTIKFTLGINARSGNTEQIDFTSMLSLKRRTAESRFLLDYIGNLSKTDAVTGSKEETINNHRLTGSLDKYVTRYFFYTPINAEFFRDPFQNIDQRITIGAGLGYTFIDDGKIEWDISAGPAYLSTRYVSVQAGDEISVSSGSLAVSTNLDIEINKTIDFIYKYNITLSKSETGGYTHHMIATFESEITKKLDLDISLIWDRISKPTTDDTGILPEPNDYRLVLGVSYSF